MDIPCSPIAEGRRDIPSTSMGEGQGRLTSPFCVSKRGTRQAKRDAGGSYTPDNHHHKITTPA